MAWRMDRKTPKDSSHTRSRFGERALSWFRRERVFASGASWYFRTREGIDVGPYGSRFEAEVEADILIARLSHEQGAPSLMVIRTFMLESVVDPSRNPRLVDIGAQLGR